MIALFCLPSLAQDKCRINVTLPANVQNGTFDVTNLDILSELIEPDKVNFEGNKFSVEIECREQPYLSIFRVQADSLRDGAWFIIEKGEVDIVFDYTKTEIVRGTPLNNAYYQEVTVPKETWWREIGEPYAEREKRMTDKTWSEADEAEYKRLTSSPTVVAARKSERDFMFAHINLPGVVGQYILQNGIISERPDLSVWPREYADFVNAKWADFDAKHVDRMRGQGLSEEQIAHIRNLLDGIRKKNSVPKE